MSYHKDRINFGPEEANRMALTGSNFCDNRIAKNYYLREKYLKKYHGPYRAAIAFIDDLMAGDAATFKAGYSRENAIIAALETFPINREDLMEILDH